MQTKNNYYVPMVVEQQEHGERSYDIYSRLLKDRIILIGSEIDDYVANVVIAQLLYLQSEDKKKPINIYVNSPGGVVTSGLAIYDTMQFIEPEICTWCVGQACSMGAVLLAAGTKGKRFALENSRIMIHQPSGGCHGQASDVEIQAKEMQKIKETISKILANHTGKDAETIKKDSERDYFMSAEEAVLYGLVDTVVKKK